MSKIDWSKPLRVQGSWRKARYIPDVFVRNPDGYNRLVIVEFHESSREVPVLYNDQGESADNCSKLENVPERRHVFQNVYRNRMGTAQKSLDDCDAVAEEGRLGVLELIYDDDELVDQIYHGDSYS